MQYKDALESMNATNNGAKRGSMVGYIWKFTTAKNGQAALTAEQVEAGDYYLALVQRDGDQFLYKHTGATGKFTYLGKVAQGSGNALDNTTSPTDTNTLDFDADLMTHIGKGEDWATGKQSDFEGVRLPGSSQW